jgi:RNA polymerase sigma-70 factor (ECF subfamily)
VEPPPRETGEIDALAVREELGMLLEKLDPAERECLLRHHHRGQSIAQIAAEIGMPSGTVKSHLYRGRQRLRRTWILGGAMILAVVLTRFLISDTELQAGELITVEISRGAAGVHQPAPSRVERLSTTTAGDGATFSLEVVQERRQYR